MNFRYLCKNYGSPAIFTHKPVWCGGHFVLEKGWLERVAGPDWLSKYQVYRRDTEGTHEFMGDKWKLIEDNNKC